MVRYLGTPYFKYNILQFSLCKETLLNLLDGYSKILKERVLPYAVEIKVRRGRSMATNYVVNLPIMVCSWACGMFYPSQCTARVHNKREYTFVYCVVCLFTSCLTCCLPSQEVCNMLFSRDKSSRVKNAVFAPLTSVSVWYKMVNASTGKPVDSGHHWG